MHGQSQIAAIPWGQSKDRFTRICTALKEILAEVAGEVHDDSLTQRIAAAQASLDRTRMNVLVVGEFSRGKSTFINALLGAPVLPAKVNPTTATINVIEGGDERSMTIVYRDGTKEKALLPEERVNKFLDQHVTTRNESSGAIQEIQITWPRAQLRLNCLIVDTPGVNDLDDMREELTYGYIGKADACIVILDSQQPLSESERRFLRDKVLSRDVSRLFFVLNRMDEIPRPNSPPEDEIRDRLIAYIERRLTEHLSLARPPIIRAVAAKPALRSRYKGEPDPWETEFSGMEGDLERFVNDNATRNRLPDHIVRAAQIINDAISVTGERSRLLSLSQRELSAELDQLRREEQVMQSRIRSCGALLSSGRVQLTRGVEEHLTNGLSELKGELLSATRQCESDADLLELKSRAARGIRDVLERCTALVADHRATIAKQMSEHFEDLCEVPTRSMARRQSGSFGLTTTFEFDQFSNKDVRETDLADVGVQFLAGGALGIIAATMFGPFGLAAAVAGGFFMDHKTAQRKAAADWERIRRETMANVQREIDQVIAGARSAAIKIAERESECLTTTYHDRATSRLESLSKTLNDQRKGVNDQTSAIEEDRQRLQNTSANLDRILVQVQRLAQEVQ